MLCFGFRRVVLKTRLAARYVDLVIATHLGPSLVLGARGVYDSIVLAASVYSGDDCFAEHLRRIYSVDAIVAANDDDLSFIHDGHSVPLSPHSVAFGLWG